MSLRREATRATIWSFIQFGGIRAVDLIVLPVLARLVSPEEFGLMALAIVYTEFLRVLVGQGFGDAVIQRQAVERQHLDTAFISSVVLGVVFAAATLVFAGTVADVFREPGLTAVVRALSPIFILGGLNGVQEALYRRALRFRALAMRHAVASVGGAVVGIATAVMGWGVWSLVVLNLSRRAILSLMLWITPEWTPRLGFSWKHFRDLFAFGVHIVGYNAVNTISVQGDKLLVGYFLGTTTLGYYVVAYRIVSALASTIERGIGPVAFVAFSRVQGEIERARRGFCVATRAMAIATIPAFAGMIVLAPEVVTGFFGSRWAPSIPILRILSLIGIPLVLLGLNGAVIRGCGKPARRLWISIVQTGLNIAALVFFVRWGVQAMATGYAFSMYLLLPLWYLAFRRLVQIRLADYLGYFAPALLGAAAMVVVVLGVRFLMAGSPVLVRLAVAALAGGAAYVATVHLTDRSALRLIWGLIGIRSKDASAPGA